MENFKHQEVNKELLAKISMRIKELRKIKGVSQEAFITDTGINISRIESCKSNFSITTMEKICSYLGVTLEEFFSEGF